MVHLIDTFNGRRISSHRTLDAAVKADRKYQRAVKSSNGQSSYIPTQYRDGGNQRNWRTESAIIDSDDVLDAWLD